MNGLTNNPLNEGALDKILDKALATYTSADPRFGLEDRVEARLAAESLVPRRPMLFSPWVWATCAALAAALAIATIHHRRQPSTESKQQPNPVSAPQLANANRMTRESPPLPRHPTAPANARRYASRIPPPSAMDAVALKEMRAPSHPAPEEPLTQEEKLLLRVVHRADPQEMAMLNPEVREKHEAEDEAEFRRFVEQSNKEDRE